MSPTAPAAPTPRQLLAWSIRRELWEHRSILVAPAAIAAVVFVAASISCFGLPETLRRLAELGPSERHADIVRRLSLPPAPIMMATVLVGFFYSLDALYGERRDRSILFWKSLPISNRLTVLAKLMVSSLVLPLYAFALSVLTFGALLLVSTVIVTMAGLSPLPIWSEVRFVQEPIVMLYGVAVHALWFLPIHGWLLLVSAWARRTPILWAVLPVVGLLIVDQILFNSRVVFSLVSYRIAGAMSEAFSLAPEHNSHGIIDRVSQLAPLRFLTTPGLWLGIVVAAGCLALATRIRRDRTPI